MYAKLVVFGDSTVNSVSLYLLRRGKIAPFHTFKEFFLQMLYEFHY